MQSIGKGCGLHIDRFSAHFDVYEFILDDFLDFVHFGVDSDGLTLLPEGLRTLREYPADPGLCANVLWRSYAASVRSQNPGIRWYSGISTVLKRKPSARANAQ